MKKLIKKIIMILVLAALVGGIAALIMLGNRSAYVEDVTPDKLRWAYELLAGSLNTEDFKYTDYLLYSDGKEGTGSSEANPEGGLPSDAFGEEWTVLPYDGTLTVLHYNETAEYHVNVQTPGIYTLELDYMSAGGSYLDHTAAVEINGEYQYQELKTIDLPLYWQNQTGEKLTDRYGDQIAPSQERVTAWRTASLYNNTYSSVAPLKVTLKAGENTIRITNVSNDGLALGKLVAAAMPAAPQSYAQYAAAHENDKCGEHPMVLVNATDYVLKNSSEIIYESTSSPAVTPYDAEYKLLNTLHWTDPGDEITYEVNAPETGLYMLSFHYKSEKQEFTTYESIYVDGQVPYAELQAYPFPYTGGSWENETLSDAEGNPYYIYLTAGKHTLTLKSELEPITAAWRYGQLVAEHATVFSLEIKKIAGEDPDKYRTWKMTRYIPEIPDYLEAYEVLIQHIRYLLQNDSDHGINGAQLAYLDKAEKFIQDMAEYPDEIALYTKDLSGDDNSVLVSVSQFTSSIMKMDFRLDAIYLSTNDDLPSATPGIFTSLKDGFDSIYYSFVSEKYTTQDADEDTLTIWVNRSLQHVDLLQKMVDTEFTRETGIPVKITVIPDAGKLTLAAAADQTPDLALGLGSYMPFDLASRGALYDMSQFEDFWEVNNRFAVGAMVPYVYNEGVYAIPETLDFQAIVYRTDIFNNLDLDVPDTWDELRVLLPVLQRYGMNFYHNCSYGRTGYKWFYQTTPLIFQNGGKLYTEDGTATAIDSVESVNGLKELGDLFVAYSLDIQVNEFFNSFRYSALPVGIVDSNSYNLIMNGAPELDGQWALSPFLGTEQADGTMDRSFVAASTGGVIFKDTKHANEAWEFLKWWTETETQVEYTYTLRSTYGDVYFWLPSNLEALNQAPIAQEDKQIIMEMADWIRDVPRTPGQYLLERSISDIWNTMVNDGTSAQVAADEKAIDVNREIRKMMRELGYFDEAGNQIQSYVIRDVDWIQAQRDAALGKEN